MMAAGGGTVDVLIPLGLICNSLNHFGDIGNFIN